MQDYLFFTDSTGDLTPDLVAEMDATVLPMAFTLDDKSYHNYPDNRELDPHLYYDRLRAGATSTTSQLNAETLKSAFRPALAAGHDVFYLAFSSGLSGTYQSSRIAKEDLEAEFPGRRVVTVDSLNASMGEGLVAYEAAMQRKAGLSMDELAAYVTENAQRWCAWFTVDDLMFLKRGGRLSGGAAVAGTLLGIKPVLHVDPAGHLINMEKVRGRKASLDSLIRHYAAHAVDKADHPVFISHGDCPADCDYVARGVKAAGAKRVCIGTIGPVIGAHSGPGTVAMFFWGDEAGR